MNNNNNWILMLFDWLMRLLGFKKIADSQSRSVGDLGFSDDCVRLVKHFEGIYLDAYQDVVGVWTIGYGHTSGVRRGMRVTEKRATELLGIDLDKACRFVNKYVKVKLKQHQLDALVSFVFNLGVGNFSKSTLLKKLNKKDYAGASNEFPRWKYAGKKVYRGLVRRRKAERDLFNGIVRF